MNGEFRCIVAELRDTLVTCERSKSADSQTLIPQSSSNTALQLSRCHEEATEVKLQNANPGVLDLPDTISLDFNSRSVRLGAVVQEGGDKVEDHQQSINKSTRKCITYNRPDSVCVFGFNDSVCEQETQESTKCLSLGSQGDRPRQQPFCSANQLLEEEIRTDTPAHCQQNQQAYAAAADPSYNEQPKIILDLVFKMGGNTPSATTSNDLGMSPMNSKVMECDTHQNVPSPS